MNPLKALQDRMEAARMGREASMQDFIERNNPGGMRGWQNELATMDPGMRERLTPLSTRMLRGLAGGMSAGARAAGGAARGAMQGMEGFAKRLGDTRMKALMKMGKKVKK